MGECKLTGEHGRPKRELGKVQHPYHHLLLWSREATIISYGFISTAVSWRKMASGGDLLAMAPHMMAGGWVKAVGAMRPRIRVHMIFTSMAVHTMGR